jgi:serine/threonine protein kinase
MATQHDDWKAVKVLFEAALEENAANRSSFLKERCQDAGLRAEVERLLAEHDQAPSFLSTPVLGNVTIEVDVPAPNQKLSEGDVLAKRFRIVRFIAGGGMGEVYEAEDQELRERVAVKIIRPEIVRQPNAVTRFKREVHLARKVTHPNVCRIFDLFRHQTGPDEEMVFISMELLHGETLAARLKEGGRMSVGEASPLIGQMASALAAAHEVGVVHRDFKPGNVVLVGSPGQWRAVVTDFGLALRSVTCDETASLSSGHGLIGTLIYMAPEQLEGQQASSASDIYSLGLVIFEMVTGVRPFQGDTPMSTAAKRLAEAPPSPRKFESSLSFVFESVILRCLARDPAKRFANAQDVAKALRDDVILRGEGLSEQRGEPSRLELAGTVLEGDAFISYAYMDDLELIEGHKGWVANLHRALGIRLGQLLGKRPEIWRDPKLQGNDSFDEMLIERLRHVAALVSVVSPPYVKSEWARRELAEFWKAAEQQGGVRFRDKARIFKVLKTPVPFEMHPTELKSLLGYPFFNVDADTGRVRELDEVFGPEAQRDFWIRLDDLAHDICRLLEMVEASGTGVVPKADAQKAVFLAQTTFDLRDQREAIKRDLEQHGYTVLPDKALPQIESEVKGVVRADLARCQMSIHLVGKNFSLVPEGGMQSLLEIQNELAIERGGKGDFSRLLWIPLGMKIEDGRQRRVVEQLRMDPRISKGADLLETFLEDLKTEIQRRLKEAQNAAPAPPQPSTSTVVGSNHARLYLIYDERDTEITSPWEDFLFEQELEVIRPVFKGDEAEVREYHEENLRSCDGALILFGSANECWLRRKLRELQKSRGYGRTKPMTAVAISLVPPRTADKERFRTHEALVIPQWDGFSPDPLQPLISRLKG